MDNGVVVRKRGLMDNEAFHSWTDHAKMVQNLQEPVIWGISHGFGGEESISETIFV